MSMEFARKHRFKLKKLEYPIYIRNINSIFNQESSIKHTVKYFLQRTHRKDRDRCDRKKEVKYHSVHTLVSLT